jgi:hypothetical protein
MVTIMLVLELILVKIRAGSICASSFRPGVYSWRPGNRRLRDILSPLGWKPDLGPLS